MNNYGRVTKLPLNNDLELGSGKTNILGRVVKLNTRKIKCFMRYGYDCGECGLKATHWAVEDLLSKNGGKRGTATLNLYGTKDDGTEVMMTMDHVIPRSRGGGNVMSNLQTLCFECNAAKGDRDARPAEGAGYDYYEAKEKIKRIVLASGPDVSKKSLYSQLMSVLRDVYIENKIPMNRRGPNAEAQHESTEEGGSSC